MRCSFATLVVLAGCRPPAEAVIGALDDPWVVGQSRCAVAGGRSSPLIVEWPAADRGSLEMRLRRGLVAVRYEGCRMEVLRSCSVPGSSYAYGGFTRKAETVRIDDEDELYANLPVGAARLSGQLQRAKALAVSMTMVGMYDADRSSVSRDQLQGDCANATHIIGGVQVGAYAFFAEGSADLGARAELTSPVTTLVPGDATTGSGPGIGARTAAQRQLIESDGNPEACRFASPSDDTPPENCGALLRLEVVPIGKSPLAAICPGDTRWDGTQCTSPEPRETCPAGFAPSDDGCTRASTPPCDPADPACTREPLPRCPPGTTRSADGCNPTRPAPRCAPGMSWIPTSEPGTGFCLDDLEVTTWSYAYCVAAGACPVAATTVWRPDIPAAEQDAASELCNALVPGRDDHPINCIPWPSADAYCRWRDARLPTAAELTLAAAGGDAARRFPWGDSPPDPTRVNACGEECRAWFHARNVRRDRIAYRGDDGWPTTAPVGSFHAGASRWGPEDLAGNVAEWTATWADATHTRRRVLGGSFLVQRSAWLSTADTIVAAPTRRDAVIGFRCASD